MRPVLAIALVTLFLAPVAAPLGLPLAPAGSPCAPVAVDGCRAWSVRAEGPPNTTFTGGLVAASDSTAYAVGVLRGPGNLFNFAGLRLAAIDRASGAELWSEHDPSRFPGAIAALADGLAHFTHVGAESRTYLELRDAQTGAIESRTLVAGTDPIYPRLLVARDGLLYGLASVWRPLPYPGALPVTDVLVVAMHAETQTVVWSRVVDVGQFDYGTDLVFLGDDLFVTFEASWPTTSVTLKLDPATGAEDWRAVKGSFDGLAFAPSLVTGFTRPDGEPVLAFTATSFAWEEECLVAVGSLVRRFCTLPERAWVWTISARTGETLWAREWSSATPQINTGENPLAEPPSGAWGIAATRDGSGIFVGGHAGFDPQGAREQVLLKLDAATGATAWTWQGMDVATGTPTPTPDGTRVVAFDLGQRMQVRDVATGAMLFQADQPCATAEPCHVYSLVPSADASVAHVLGAIRTNGEVSDSTGSMPRHDLTVAELRLR